MGTEIKKTLELQNKNFICIDTRLDNYELLEKQSTVISIKNLLTYKVVKEAVFKKNIKIFALWYDIHNSNLEIYSEKKKKFLKIK